MKIIVTGGAGFIGSALIRYLINITEHQVLNIDKLTYAGNLESLRNVENSSRYSFVQLDICNYNEIKKTIFDFKPDCIMHLAAESHVDRSINGPGDFIQTNIVGTYTLLDTCCLYWGGLNEDKKKCFRFHHISTDEVYGSLGKVGYFTEKTAYSPNSPYSASKASSDHLVRAWYKTYGLPILITNCSNNYGPYQYPEKLIPQTILCAIKGKPIPVYGKGDNIRDWLYVDDHVKALYRVLIEGQVGETYNIGGNNEVRNIDVVKIICNTLEELKPDKPSGIKEYESLITFVKDRPGHDYRYAIDAGKINNELDWFPDESFKSGIKKTIKWYLENRNWLNYREKQ